MATATETKEVQEEVFLDHDESIETLQDILAREQLEPVSYEEARMFGYDLMTFFEIFDEPSNQGEESDGDD